MATIISIDGACRRNGKPDCLAAGAAYIQVDQNVIPTLVAPVPQTICVNEQPSTNQRGEMKALIAGLEVGITLLRSGAPTVYFITDSEYLFNSITKEWYKGWAKKGWLTVENNPVKNQDLWMKIADLVDKYDSDEQFVMYHVKGHVVSIGKVTAASLIARDPSSRLIATEVSKKFDELLANPLKREVYTHAVELFERNNGFTPPTDIFKEMVICNMVSDLVAGKYIDEIDAQD